MMSAADQAASINQAWGGHDSYKGASHTRREGALWTPGSTSADTALQGALQDLRDRSSDLVRNVPIAWGAIDTLENHVVGTGLYCQPTMDNEILKLSDDQLEALEDAFKREFELWGSTVECDVERTSSWDELQQIAFRSWHERGDVGVALPMFVRPGSVYETKVQLIEADRITNPMGRFNTDTLVDGVEKDRIGAPLAYHVLRSHPGDAFLTADLYQTDRIEAFGRTTGRRNFWLLSDKPRVGQTRGVPYLASVMNAIKQSDRYTDAELAAAVVGGSFTVFIKSEEDGDFSPLASMPFGAGTDGSGDTDYALDYGAIVPLRPGESIESANPARPNKVFGEFLQSIFRQVGMGTGIPVEILIKMFQGSYSASRAALLEGNLFFSKKRGRFSKKFAQPVYEAVITEAILKGRLTAPGFLDDPMKRIAYTRVNWIGPSYGQVNPTDEAEAAEKRIKMGVSSLAIETPSLTGQDWRAVHKQRAREMKARTAADLQVSPSAEIAAKNSTPGPNGDKANG